MLLNIAIAQVKLKKNDKAISALNLAIKYNPKYAKAYVKRGEVYVMLEDYNEAIRDFGEASSIDPAGFGVQEKLKDAQKRKKQAGRKDYYKILGVPNGKQASDAELRKAYKKACLKWHPDKNSGSEEQRVKAEKMFKDVNEAMNVLGDRDKRHAYDEGGDPEEILQGRSGMGGGANMADMSDIFQMFMGGGGMGGGMGGGFPGGARRGGRGRGGGGNPFEGMNFGQQAG